MKTTNNISKYRVTWVELKPVNSDIVPNHDRKVFGDVTCFGKMPKYHKHFPDRESALNWLKTFSEKLDRRYECRLFTDAQFAKAVNLQIPFTKKQASEVYYIG